MKVAAQIDWSQCPLVEVKANVEGGAPVLQGIRMPANAIVDNFDYGLSIAEIAGQFESSEDLVEEILICGKSHRIAHPV